MENVKLVFKGNWKLDQESLKDPDVQENLFLFQKVGQSAEMHLLQQYFLDSPTQ